VAALIVVGVLAPQVVAATSQARADLAHARSLELQVAEVLRLQPSMLVLHRRRVFG